MENQKQWVGQGGLQVFNRVTKVGGIETVKFEQRLKEIAIINMYILNMMCFYIFSTNLIHSLSLD